MPKHVSWEVMGGESSIMQPLWWRRRMVGPWIDWISVFPSLLQGVPEGLLGTLGWSSTRWMLISSPTVVCPLCLTFNKSRLEQGMLIFTVSSHKVTTFREARPAPTLQKPVRGTLPVCTVSSWIVSITRQGSSCPLWHHKELALRALSFSTWVSLALAEFADRIVMRWSKTSDLAHHETIKQADIQVLCSRTAVDFSGAVLWVTSYFLSLHLHINICTLCLWHCKNMPATFVFKRDLKIQTLFKVIH